LFFGRTTPAHGFDDWPPAVSGAEFLVLNTKFHKIPKHVIPTKINKGLHPFLSRLLPSLYYELYHRMSCNICHAPILVAPQFLNPTRMDRVTQKDHLLPIVNQVCPEKDHQPYFRDVMWLDYKFEGIVGYDTVHAGRGVFISRNWIHLDGGMPTAIYQEETNDQGRTTDCVSSPEGSR